MVDRFVEILSFVYCVCCGYDDIPVSSTSGCKTIEQTPRTVTSILRQGAHTIALLLQVTVN